MQPVHRTISVVFAILVLTAGCGLEAGPSAFDDQTVDDGDNGDDSPAATDLGTGPGAGTLEGTWLQVHVSSQCVFDQEQRSVSYHLVDIETDGAGLAEDRRHCGLELSELLGSRPVATDELLATVKYPRVDRGLVSRPSEGGHYSSATAVGLWGIELDAPLDESVPDDPDDDRVVDADGDGNPGVTMQLVGAGCDRYMGQRQIINYQGRLEAPNDIRGTSVTSTETVVYGGTSTACEVAPEVVSNDDHNFFRMVRVDGRGGAVDATGDDGDIGCGDVTEYFDDIWEIREPDDTHCE